MAAVQSLDFGTLLRRSRRAAGLTQEELADRAGLSVRGISDLERGAKHRPHKDTVQLLADTLGLSGEERATFEAAARGVVAVPSDLPSTEFRIFLIADVRGYTRFTLEHGDEAAAKLAAKFARIAREGVSDHGGQVIELRGDEALAVFSSVRGALRAAVDLQERFSQETMADTTLPLKVGIGLDAGEAIAVEDGYRGAALNLAARLCSLAGPREVLASEAVVHLARKLEGLTYLERGAVQLKGFADPVRVVQVVSEDAVQIGSDEDGSGAESMRESPLPIGGFLGALPAGPLVARDDEVRRVMSAVHAVAGGSGRLVLLVGEPGVGKTRLAQEVTLAVRNRGFLVASGRCYAPQQVVPYYPFLEALATAYAAAPSGIRTSTQHRWPYLARLLPDQLGPAPTSSSEGQEEQQRLLRAVTGFLVAIAAEMPVALLLDDLHWADSATLDLLQHLARHTRAHRVLLLGTHRDLEVGRQRLLEQALRDLTREQLVERIEVRRLGQDETAALMAASFGETGMSKEFAGLVHEHTQGNPFFTQEVLRALVERGDVYRVNGGWSRRDVTEIEVPESIRSAIRERVSRLSDGTQAVLHEASVLGHTFAFDDLQALTGHSEDEVDAALEECDAAGLLRETGRETYGFNHVLTQQALYTDLSARRRRKLHLAAGEALERLYTNQATDHAAELAHHFVQAGERHRALRYVLLAGDQAESVFAHQEGERHYRTALELAREVGATPQEAEALAKLGSVLRTIARYDEALELLDQAVRLRLSMGDVDAAGRAMAEIGRVHFFNGSFEEGIEAVQSFLDTEHDSLPSAGLAASYLALSLVLQHLDVRAALAAAERASELARAVGDDRILVEAEGLRGGGLTDVGRLEEGIRVLEDIIPLAERVADTATVQLMLVGLAWAYTNEGAFDKGVRLSRRALKLAEQMDDPSRVAFMLAELGWQIFLRGEWEDARRQFERALPMVRSLDSPWVWWPLFCLGRLNLAEGRWGEAAESLEEAVEVLEAGGLSPRLPDAHGLLAEWDLLQERADEARLRLRALLDRPDLQSVDTSACLWVLAWAYLELDVEDQAEETALRAVEEATTLGRRIELVHALRVLGMLRRYQGRWDEGQRVFEEAVHLARSMPYPYAEARALYEWGLLRLQKGDPQQGQERLEEALAIFQRLGARPHIERAEQALAKLG